MASYGRHDIFVEFLSLQYALYMSCFVCVLGGAFFLATALFIQHDREQTDRMLKGLYPLVRMLWSPIAFSAELANKKCWYSAGYVSSTSLATYCYSGYHCCWWPPVHDNLSELSVPLRNWLLRCSASINQHVVPSITYGGRAFSFSVPRPLYQPPDLSLSLDVQTISENVCCIVCSLLITATLL